MDRVRWAGSLMMASAVIAILTSELIAPAYASRGDREDYAVAISAGSSLELRRRPVAADGAVNIAPVIGSARTLHCRGIVNVAGVKIGYDCHAA